MTRRRLLLVIAAAAMFRGCTTSDGPSEPVWGKQPCAHCAMVLSERRFAAQMIAADGDRFFFDDPGCMVVFAESRGLTRARAWVYDEEGGRWLDARGARYAAGAATPMDYGFAVTGSGGLDWDEMRAGVFQKGKVAR